MDLYTFSVNPKCPVGTPVITEHHIKARQNLYKKSLKLVKKCNWNVRKLTETVNNHNWKLVIEGLQTWGNLNDFISHYKLCSSFSFISMPAWDRKTLTCHETIYWSNRLVNYPKINFKTIKVCFCWTLAVGHREMSLLESLLLSFLIHPTVSSLFHINYSELTRWLWTYWQCFQGQIWSLAIREILIYVF